MMIREPIVAGTFYEAKPDACSRAASQLFADYEPITSTTGCWYGGLVPHAGWVCSGAVAAHVFATLAAACKPTTLILFGGVHRYRGRMAAMFSHGRWETPLGPVEVDQRLAERIAGHTNLIADDPYAHEEEHSIEVQLPLIKHVFPEAMIVPIMVPIMAAAHEVGEAVARTLSSYDYDALIVGTTDLTHYGPRYGFTPEGVGAKANAWAKEVNDSRFVDLLCELKHDKLVAEASQYRNACSAGAAAATLGAVRALGATEGILLDQTSSAEVLSARCLGDMSDSVGYAGIVFA